LRPSKAFIRGCFSPQGKASGFGGQKGTIRLTIGVGEYPNLEMGGRMGRNEAGIGSLTHEKITKAIK